MIYDPKKPIAPPPQAKPSPRVRDGFARQGKASSEGICRGCQGPYAYSEEVVDFVPAGKLESTETWHQQCWKDANKDFFDRPNLWPWK